MREILSGTGPPVTKHKSAAVKATVKAASGINKGDENKQSLKHPPLQLDTSAISAERVIKLRMYPLIGA